MTPLLVINILIVYFVIRKVIDLYVDIKDDRKKLKKGLPEILQLATFALFFGIFSQIIGLYQAMQAIEQMGQISQAMLAGGLKVSFITTIYGMIIFSVSAVCWFFLNRRYRNLLDRLDQNMIS